MKRIAIVGGGISGCFAAIRIKEKHNDYIVDIFEHNDKLLKKIYATGNGKCNFANSETINNQYNDKFANEIVSSFNYEEIVKYFKSIGVESKNINSLIYPYSESAETVAYFLNKRIKELNINVHLSIEVKDYQNDQLLTDRGTFKYDSLIISVGGKSSPKLGSTGLFWDVLLKHGYEIKKESPSLCPIKTKENTHLVDGLRHKVNICLYQGKKLIHEESGELLFKKDGLSGMVIFNMSHYINCLDNKKDVTLHIDFAKDKTGDYESLVNPKLAKYLLDNKLDIHNTIFTFKDFYGFDNSQVTSGGVILSNLNKNLSSKKENNVYFIGEVINIDAICGGYNIMWAFSSAEKVAENI